MWVWFPYDEGRLGGLGMVGIGRDDGGRDGGSRKRGGGGDESEGFYFGEGEIWWV